MALFRKFTAIGLSLSLMLGAASAVKTSAAYTASGPAQSFDCRIGESVTYYSLGKTETTSDSLLNEQWALNNDGTFTEKSGMEYNNYFDFPSMNDSWSDYYDFPSIEDSWNDFFNWDSGWDFMFSFASRGRGTTQKASAVKDVDINIEQAWKKYNSKSSNKEVIVAVIDTGVDYSHEDLKDSIWVNEDEIPDNGIDDDKNGYIDDVYGWNFYDNSNKVYTGRNDDHGTHCAGTIAASNDNGTGIASVTGGTKVKVMVLKALGGYSGTGDTIEVVQAIKYAEANGASIVNLSLGSSYSDELLYNTIASSSMLFVVAAGNGNSFSGRGIDNDRTPCYPASYELDNIISVANLNYDGNLHNSSNYGAKSVDIAAPGSAIVSTTPNNGYEYMTGTSMSAPFVTAAAAMVYSYYKNITLSDVKTILLDSAKKLDTLDGKVVSGGMLDVGAALSYDTSKLSHKAFTVQKAKGKAPEFSYSVYKQNNKIYLSVTVNDADNDLYGLFYADGERTAEDFGFGSLGTEYTLRNTNTASFIASDLGTYSFYALDSEGHESVLVIDLSKENIEERADSNEQSRGRGRSGRGSDSYYGGGWFWFW